MKLKIQWPMLIKQQTTMQLLRPTRRVNKSDVPAYLRKQKGEEPLTLKDLEKEKSAGKISHKDTLAKNRGETDEGSEEQESGKMNVQELAEFITSFYDKDSGTFPKGPEGVCTMVGKKFGEQAEQLLVNL
jgi:hypothetical protein